MFGRKRKKEGVTGLAEQPVASKELTVDTVIILTKQGKMRQEDHPGTSRYAILDILSNGALTIGEIGEELRANRMDDRKVKEAVTKLGAEGYVTRFAL